LLHWQLSLDAPSWQPLRKQRHKLASRSALLPNALTEYYDAAPYDCAPYRYYGPEWFTGDIFIGTGPWFHGSENFRGHVNFRFHPEHGYNAPKPARGEKPEPTKHLDKVDHFKGNEVRDGHGHVGGGKRQEPAFECAIHTGSQVRAIC